MSVVEGNDPPESGYSGGLKTELSLALPGGGGAAKPMRRAKRGLAETVNLDMENSCEDEYSSVVTQSSPSE